MVVVVDDNPNNNSNSNNDDDNDCQRPPWWSHSSRRTGSSSFSSPRCLGTSWWPGRGRRGWNPAMEKVSSVVPMSLFNGKISVVPTLLLNGKKSYLSCQCFYSMEKGLSFQRFFRHSPVCRTRSTPPWRCLWLPPWSSCPSGFLRQTLIWKTID